MNDEKSYREKTILHFLDPTLVRVDEVRTIVLLEKDAENDVIVTGYFAEILCEIEALLNEGYILYKKESILGKHQ